jgi:hypothetical protein
MSKDYSYLKVIIRVEILLHDLLGVELGLKIVSLEVGGGGRNVDSHAEDENS